MARECYFFILEQVDKIVYVRWLERNRYMLDHTACLLTIDSGEQRRGTAMTVRYDQKLG